MNSASQLDSRCNKMQIRAKERANRKLNHYSLLLLLLAQSVTISVTVPISDQQVGVPIWLSDTKESKKVSENEKLSEILRREGPNMRASSDYRDFTDIKLNESIEAWKIMHEKTREFAQDQAQFYKPKVARLLKDANTSLACQKSVQMTITSIEHLESWSIQMWSSTGNFPPAAMLDGQFTDLGSYRGCIDLKIPSNVTLSQSGSNETLPKTGHTSYCVVPFRPVVPSRQPFHMIFNGHKELANLFNRSDLFHDLGLRAQYFHYIYWKTGVCVPHQCSPQDIQQVANLVGRRLALMSGPVKCFTHALAKSNAYKLDDLSAEFGSQTKPILIEVDAPMNDKQVLATAIIGAFLGLVLLSTLWHVAELLLDKAVRWNLAQSQDNWDEEEERDNSSSFKKQPGANGQINIQMTGKQEQPIKPIEQYCGVRHVAFNYLSLITNWRDFLDTTMRPNEIGCLHGLRVLTMIWIIVVHSLQYNDWSGFTRAFENEGKLKNPLLQPLYNANYVVDNFFFMSGLLAAYTTWHANKGSGYRFSALANLVGRYLRLTPQVLLISLMYVVLPLAGNSPFWYDMSEEASQDCQRNWWVNLLHIQSFYRTDEMCNLVSWWISVDMLYYVISLYLVYMILNQQTRRALVATGLLVAGSLLQSARIHYGNRLTPNNLASVPQVNEVWARYVLEFAFSPFPHAYPFFLGLWSGYMLANNMWRRQVRRWSRFGWTLASLSLIIVNLSSNIWISGRVPVGEQYISTLYNGLCSVVWATAFGWIVIACHYGCATKLSNFLSIEFFVLLSKASFIIYLSHMLIVRLYFGLQNTLLEVSMFAFVYSIVGNVVLSIAFGVFLCVAFEGPFMKFHKLIVPMVKGQTNGQTKKVANSYDAQHFVEFKEQDKNAIGPAGNVLLK